MLEGLLLGEVLLLIYCSILLMGLAMLSHVWIHLVWRNVRPHVALVEHTHCIILLILSHKLLLLNWHVLCNWHHHLMMMCSCHRVLLLLVIIVILSIVTSSFIYLIRSSSYSSRSGKWLFRRMFIKRHTTAIYPSLFSHIMKTRLLWLHHSPKVSRRHTTHSPIALLIIINMRIVTHTL